VLVAILPVPAAVVPLADRLHHAPPVL